MADTVTTSIQENGFNNAVVVFTNVSDGTGEAGVTKIDATSTGPYGVSRGGQLFYPGIHLAVRRISYTIRGMSVRLLWTATADQDFMVLGESGDELDFGATGGIRVPPALVGATGSIKFTTLGAAANSVYSITLWLRKNVPVA